MSNLVLCFPDGQSIGEAFPEGILKQETLRNSLYRSIVSGAIPWILMICAMMFPLLKRPVRHVAFSVQKRNRETGILLFLTGYILVWSLVGIVFHSIPILTEFIAGNHQLPINFNFLAGTCFLFAAIISWLPNRRVTLMKCELTMPIRLHGWNFLKDSVTYGMKIGIICLQMCWMIMIGLMLIHHSIFIMLAASFILVTERYLVPHDSKLTGSFWLLLGGMVMITGI
ncbi:DUF2182 domain-containing protein [Fluviicola sp.]|uniref:copper chaperone n=1 Tax=Fluviicola sp. TaxID=1917219 RepID=UPI002613B780|nr:DUF2182 domain-containing protein [Fluviicola sp.]